MRSLPQADADVLVIGHGIAGSVASSFLASKGKKVALIGCGTTSTELSTGCIIGSGGEEEGQWPRFLMPRLKDMGMEMSHVTRPLLTNLGTEYKCDYAGKIACEPMTNEDLAFLSIVGDQDLDADLASAMLYSSKNMVSRAYWTDLCIGKDRKDVAPLDLYELLGAGVLKDALVDRISEIDESKVVIPPVFPLHDHIEAIGYIGRRSGRKVVEPVTPMSLPGKRLQQALHGIAANEGCRMMLGREVTSIQIKEGRASSAMVRSGGRSGPIFFSAVIIASGDLISNGSRTSGTGTISMLQEMAVGGGENATRPHASSLRGPLSKGPKIDRENKMMTNDGKVIDNMFAAGSCLPDASFACGGSMGKAIESAWVVANKVLEVI